MDVFSASHIPKLPWKTLDHDVTSGFILKFRKEANLDQHFYQSGEFAQKASVTLRTLRYYDNVGLLSPSTYTEAGYRLYTDADFFRLQQILALKFLGFSLEEIKHCLQIGPLALPETLALQKAMMKERRKQLDAIIQAIDETEKLLQANTEDWESIVRVIQVMQMTQTHDWRRKYFTEEQMKQMEELHNKSYSEEQRQKLAEWGKNWSEEDQRVADQKWGEVFMTLKRLVAEGQDPAGSEAQALARQQQDLIQKFTRGDAGIAAGLKKWYEGYGELLAEKAPFSLPYSQEEEAFLQKAVAVYREKQQ